MKQKNKHKNKAQHTPPAPSGPSGAPTQPEVPRSAATAHQPRPVVIGLFGAAFLISLYLAWTSAAGNTVAGCGPDSGCAQVLKSRWGSLLGAPVGLLGAMVYGFLLLGELRRRELDPLLTRLQTGAGVLVLAGAVWFTLVQAVIIKAFCPWCCTAHLLASLAVVLSWRKTTSPSYRPTHAMAVAIPVGLVAALAVVQLITPKPELIQRFSVGGMSNVALAAGETEIKLDPAGLPWIGTPNATVTAVAVTDFTCPHCRELHQTLAQVGDQQPGRFGVVLLPGYDEPEARDLHRLMLALWKIDPVTYHTISHAVVDESVDANAPAVLERVRTELGDKFYELAWQHSEWIDETLRLGKQVMASNRARLGIATLPQLMIGQEVVAGPPRLETVLAMLEQAPQGLPDMVRSRLAPPPDTVAATEATLSSTATVVTQRFNPLLAALTNQPSGGGGGGVGTGAAIEFESTTIDFGRVTKGDVLTGKFSFKNTGTAPLELLKLQPTCGCTTLGDWQQTVQPGESGSFEVQLDTSKFSGETSKSISLETNAKTEPDRLIVKADVWAPVRVSTSVVSFGSVIKGSPVEPKTIDVTVHEDETIEINQIICTNAYFQTKLETVEKGRKYVITVSVPELGEKMQHGEIVIPLGHPKLEDLKIPVYASPVDPLVVQPKLIVRQPNPTGAPATIPITVFCHDPQVKTFEISEPSYSGKQNVKVELDMQPNYRWGRLNVTLPAEFNAGDAQEGEEHIRFRTNHPDFPEVTVPIRTSVPRHAAPQSP